ncbi:MAG TPA: phosphatase PAP2 family protein [Acidimicrobiales bacterium]|nr:phosphatase PAP2 family protein [Acidimicrobiales bacterium]
MTTVATDRPGDGDQPGDEGQGRTRRGPRSSLRWWHEVLYIVGVYVAYSAVRNQFGSGAGATVDAGPAFHHAEAIIHIERTLRLYFEQHLQSWYLGLPAHGLVRIWNVYYGIFHFVVALTALIVLYRKAPLRYRVWRNTLAFTTLLALVGFASFSLMPPRLLDDPGTYGGCQVYTHSAEHDLPDTAGKPPCDRYGYVDTVARYGGWASFGSDEMKAVSNQYAAMPSMHIGWSTWCALVLAPLIRRRWLRALIIAYPVLTLFDIIVTGNHYWIDGLGGLVTLGVGYLLARVLTHWWEARYGPVVLNPEPESAAA